MVCRWNERDCAFISVLSFCTNNSILRCVMIPISYLCGVFVISCMGVTNLCVLQTLLGGIDI